MTFWDYWWLIAKRAWSEAVSRAKTFQFFLGPLAATVLADAFLTAPRELYPFLLRFIPFLGLATIAFFALAWGWMMIRVPHRLHLETLARIPDLKRADIRERLGVFLFDGLRLAEEAQQHGMTDQVREGITNWIVEVSAYLASDVSPSATAQFRHASKLELRSLNFGDHERLLNGISEGCSYLSKFIDRYA